MAWRKFEFESIGNNNVLNFSSTAVDAVENKEVQIQHRKFSSIMFSCRDQTELKLKSAIVMSKASLKQIYTQRLSTETTTHNDYYWAAHEKR
jgi:hypothetical protein